MATEIPRGYLGVLMSTLLLGVGPWIYDRTLKIRSGLFVLQEEPGADNVLQTHPQGGGSPSVKT